MSYTPDHPTGSRGAEPVLLSRAPRAATAVPTMRARVASALLATLAVLALYPGFAHAASLPLPGPTVKDPLDALVTPGDTMRLSDELKVTRWAHANTRNPIRSAPNTAGRTITRLRYVTEDNLPEVYLVLSAIVDAAGEVWVRIRIPMRPNGRTGWVARDNLGQLYVVRTRFVINRSTLRATLYRNASRIWHAPIGVGKAATPTPKGNFYVRELLKGDGGLYGSWAFGTSAYASISDWPNGGVVGVHGTDQPKLIPGRPSHGCVRVRNVNINRLRLLMPIGTPIQIIG